MVLLDIFEEIRFILELIIAEQVFAWSFAKRKDKFYPKFIVGVVLLILISLIYVIVKPILSIMNYGLLVRIIVMSWYMFLVILSIIHIRICYEMTFSDTLFIGIAGYSLQHIEYVIVNEIIAMGLWREVTNNLFIYIILCVSSCALLYYLVAKIFASKLRGCEGILYEDKANTVGYFLLMFIVLFTSTFICQNIFVFVTSYGSEINYQGAITDFFNCTLVLVVQYSTFRINTLNREKEIVNQLLYERQKQYKLSRENIDIINHKCHDLKHQIHALREAKIDELNEYIDEVENSIMIYSNVLKTENEVLNTILSEKSLYCEKHKIKFSCIVDGNQLGFIRTIDIYALLGNAIDNAIECVSKYNNIEKRVISLEISSKEGFLSIQTNNYYDGDLKIKDGLPLTTRKDNRYHGFGIKSMKYLAEKYGGSLYSSLNNGIFMMQIVIPIPKE